jgi:chemotaxis response regulator CheB
MIRILVVDDQALIRGGLVALFTAAPRLEVVGEAVDGAEAVAVAAETRPDVILMDIRMPVVDGIAATRRILASPGEHRPRIIALSRHGLRDRTGRAQLVERRKWHPTNLIRPSAGRATTTAVAEAPVWG